jgi:hypothetical protein
MSRRKEQTKLEVLAKRLARLRNQRDGWETRLEGGTDRELFGGQSTTVVVGHRGDSKEERIVSCLEDLQQPDSIRTRSDSKEERIVSCLE